MYSDRSRSRADFGFAPTIVFTILPPWNTDIVGIDRIWNCCAICGFSSMFSLATVSLSLCCVAISSRTGATILQGPHHSAQKSTSTGLSLASTSSWNDWSVTFLVLPTVPPRYESGLPDEQRMVALD